VGAPSLEDRAPPTRQEPWVPRAERRERNAPKAAPPSDALTRFIEVDHERRYDLVEINSTDFEALGRELAYQRASAKLILEDIDAIIRRVALEVDSPKACGVLLRKRALEWARAAPPPAADAQSEAPRKWSALFFESRETGGPLQRCLLDRLETFRLQAIDAAREPGFRVQRLVDTVVRGESFGRAPGTIYLRAAQAFLDDIAEAMKDPGVLTPMVRLSELAEKVGLSEVNRALCELLTCENSISIVLVHPSRYPGVAMVSLRFPSSRTAGRWLTYFLDVQEVAPARRVLLSDAAGRSISERAEFVEVPQAPSVDWAVQAQPPWEEHAATLARWGNHCRALSMKGDRIEPPPSGYRALPAFAALRMALLQDADVRALFMKVVWRGKPAGLAALASLLQRGQYTPEYETDSEYLEAELGDLSQGSAQFRPADGRWTLPAGWVVNRLWVKGAVQYAASHGI